MFGFAETVPFSCSLVFFTKFSKNTLACELISDAVPGFDTEFDTAFAPSVPPKLFVNINSWPPFVTSDVFSNLAIRSAMVSEIRPGGTSEALSAVTSEERDCCMVFKKKDNVRIEKIHFMFGP